MAKSNTTGETDAPRERTVVYLGNRKAVQVLRTGDGETVREPVSGKRCTTVVVRDDATLMEGVTEIQALWRHMSDADQPAWVATNNAAYAQLLAAQWPGIEIRDPEPQEG